MNSYKQLKDGYNSKNHYCETGQLGRVYIPSKMIKKPFYKNGEKTIFLDEYSKEKILNMNCNSWSCKKCRPNKKNKLHDNIQREVYIWEIDKHLIITFPGKPYRNMVSYDLSYKIMNYEFDKLLHRIYYEIKKIKEGKITRSKQPLLKDGQKLPDREFSYIVLPRAQAKPYDENNPIGFCHLHTLINYPINNKWINEIVTKNNYKFGYNFIRKNKSVADYLCNDFYDDDEWVIPFNIRHYRSSRNIKINMEYKKDEDIKIIPPYMNDSEVLDNIITKYEIRGETYKVKNIQLLPFEEYLIKFREINEVKQHMVKETKVTPYGLRNKYRTENKIFIENIGYT